MGGGGFFGFPTVWLSPRPPHSVRAGSIHCVSQQGWSLSSNKPLSHRLMPGDDKSPPRIGSDQLSAWLNPKGETERVTQCDMERQTGKGKKTPPFISPPLRLPSVYRTWQLVLTSCPCFSSFSSPSIHFHFLPVMRKFPCSFSISPPIFSLTLIPLSLVVPRDRGIIYSTDLIQILLKKYYPPFLSFLLSFPARLSSLQFFLPFYPLSYRTLILETPHFILFTPCPHSWMI